MRKRCLVVGLFSMLVLCHVQLLGGVRATPGYSANAGAPAATTAIATGTAVPFQTVCSCGVDCDSETCTFSCEGTISGCIKCIASCCSGEFRRVCGLLP